MTNLFRSGNRWLFGTAERAIERAYDAALKIKAIEDEYFDGQPISNQSVQADRYSTTMLAAFQADLRSYLVIMQLRLAEFKVSRFFGLTTQELTRFDLGRSGTSVNNLLDRTALVLEKLQFVDQVWLRYRRSQPLPPQKSTALVEVAKTAEAPIAGSSANRDRELPRDKKDRLSDVESITDKTGILPRSILGTVKRIQKELSPEAEVNLVKDFRNSKVKTIIALTLVLKLMLIPLLTQQLTRLVVFGPIVDRLRSNPNTEIFLNVEMEENTLQELERYEQKLRFENIIYDTPRFSTEEIEAKVKSKAIELAAQTAKESNNSIKNIFADIFAAIAFVVVLMTSRQEIEILKAFIDEIVYGLSDSAKAFVIILFSDIFVGFHSPHGWEVILEGISKHLGLAANREFIFVFIATFPVILDTIFKYWVFRYLNRISPSAVATYKEMNQ